MTRWVRLTAVAALLLFSACGGYGGGGGSGGGSDYGNPTGPSGGGGSVTSGATITIGANGVVSPATVTIDRGQGVTFVNNHSVVHDVSSDPHPIHTDCQPTNSIGRLQPGQTKMTTAYTTARTCGFHDHEDPDNNSLKGSIIVR